MVDEPDIELVVTVRIPIKTRMSFYVGETDNLDDLTIERICEIEKTNMASQPEYVAELVAVNDQWSVEVSPGD